MSETYRIHDVSSVEPEWMEQMGSKPKFWFRWAQDDQHLWLFKFARRGTGEDWAEKIAAELAAALHIPTATVELAEFHGRRGSISRSFVLRHEGWDLIHGNELLAGCIHGYRREQMFHQSEHTLENIARVLREHFTQPHQFRAQLEQFAGYVVLDALIGNTDRHHQNWGILRRTQGDGSLEEVLAPSFDHASSLGRNAPPEEQKRRLQEGSVGTYARRGKGGIYVTTTDRRGANPLELVLRSASIMPDAVMPWPVRLSTLSSDRIERIIDAVPDTLMDSTAKRFAVALVEYTKTHLCAR